MVRYEGLGSCGPGRSTAAVDQRFDVESDTIPGRMASSPLGIRELAGETKVPAFDASEVAIGVLADILVGRP